MTPGWIIERMNESVARPRRPWLAGVMNLVALGSGFVYLGRPVAALAILTLPLLSTLLWGQAGWMFSAGGAFAYLAMFLAVYVCVIGACVALARRQGASNLNRWQRWYVYVCFFVLQALLYNGAFSRRESLFGYETSRMVSKSMEKTLLRGDVVVIDSRAYAHAAPSRGDLVLFDAPDRPGARYLKRVVGVAGDQLEFRNHHLRIGGIPIDEAYAQFDDARNPFGWGTFNVPQGSVFVVGDNRGISLDSRAYGAIPLASLHGRARLLLYSFDDGLRVDRAGERLDQ